MTAMLAYHLHAITCKGHTLTHPPPLQITQVGKFRVSKRPAGVGPRKCCTAVSDVLHDPHIARNMLLYLVQVYKRTGQQIIVNPLGDLIVRFLPTHCLSYCWGTGLDGMIAVMTVGVAWQTCV